LLFVKVAIRSLVPIFVFILPKGKAATTSEFQTVPAHIINLNNEL